MRFLSALESLKWKVSAMYYLLFFPVTLIGVIGDSFDKMVDSKIERSRNCVLGSLDLCVH